jgi:hypothetical protein
VRLFACSAVAVQIAQVFWVPLDEVFAYPDGEPQPS